jgi:hypothetical protein
MCWFLEASGARGRGTEELQAGVEQRGDSDWEDSDASDGIAAVKYLDSTKDSTAIHIDNSKSI